jgi:hypothetical protein
LEIWKLGKLRGWGKETGYRREDFDIYGTKNKNTNLKSVNTMVSF